MPLENLPTPAEMIAYLDRRVRGQERAKRDLSLAFYEHFTGLASSESPELGGPPHSRQHMLLLGPSGSGKTYLVKQLCAFLSVPVAFWSATSMTESGYVGDDVDEPLKHLLRQARGDVRTAERGVVVLDEIDKVRSVRRGERDVSGEGVQNGLLTLLDGRRAYLRERNGEPVGMIDTGKLLFICMGAFVDLPGIVRERLVGPPQLGLHQGTRVTPPPLTTDEAYARASPEDLVSFGLLPEFVGRFPNVSAVHALSQADLVGLLRDVEDSPVDRAVRSYAMHAITLTVQSDALIAIAQRAVARGTGARGLDNVLGDALRDCSWRRHELAADGVVGVVVTPEAALGEASPMLVRGERADEPLVADVLRERVFDGVRAEAAAARSPAHARVRMVVPPKPAPPKDPHQQGLPLDAKTAAPPSTGKISRKDDHAMRVRLGALRARELAADQASPEALAWWRLFERERPVTLVLEIAEALAAHKVSIQRFYESVRESGCPGVYANLRYLEYKLAREEFDTSRGLLELISDLEGDSPKERSRMVCELEKNAFPAMPEEPAA
jgi:ATP-dependent Clp protease ATP-binding subunit ClpX